MKITITFGLLLAAIRVFIGCTVDPDPFAWVQAYKDAAHLFMGGLAVSWWVNRLRWKWWLFWGLGVLEVAVATLSRV